jgi:TonB family protein
MTDEPRRDDSFGVRNRFLTDTPPAPVRQRDRAIGGLTLSLSAHVAALVIAAVVVSRSPMTDSSAASPRAPVPLVYALPGGGAGLGGGEPSSKPVRRAQLVGPEAVALPSVQQGKSDRVQDAPDPVQRIAVPDRQVNAGLQEMIGAVSAVANPEFGSRGAGTGPGADGTRGSGSGPGSPGPGLGPGSEGPGSGGEGYPGNGVSWPRLTIEVKPNYTVEAMRARIEGVVELDIVVLADGSVGRVRLVRSLDARFGLDEEALKAVQRWRFDPARQSGKAVTVRVPVEVSFRLR